LKLFRNPEDILEFINEAGFALSKAIKGVPLKNVWDLTEDPNWELKVGPWLDKLIIEKKIIYPVVLKGKACMMQRDLLPYIYKMRSRELDLVNFSPEYYFDKGEMSRGALKILKGLEDGPKGVKELRKISDMDDPKSKGTFDKTMLDLKRVLAISKVNTTDERWGENIFGLTHLEFDKDVKMADRVDESEGYRKIIKKYLNIHGSADSTTLIRLFDFDKQIANKVLNELVNNNKISVNSSGDSKGKKCEIFEKKG